MTAANRIGQIVLIALIVSVVGVILYPVFVQRKGSRRSPGITNVKLLSLGLLMYAEENDHVLPFRDYWMDAVTTYLRKQPQALRSPVVVQEGREGYGYAFNSLLEREKHAAIPKPEETIMVYDSINYGWSASDPLLSLPNPGRYHGGNQVCYADGHARWLKVPEPSETPPVSPDPVETLRQVKSRG